jgi:hypothetical protein
MSAQEDREDQRLLQMMEEQWKDRWSDCKTVSVYWLGKGGRLFILCHNREGNHG